MIDRDHFTGQQQGERVELFLRKHPLTLVWAWRLAALLLLLGLGAVLTSWALAPSVFPGVFLGFAVLLIPITAMVLWEYALWYYDIFVVTNRRVLDFSRKPLIYEKRDETQLSRVQDVRVEFPNPLCLLVNFGNVNVQTAGTRGTIAFKFVRDPRTVQARLLRLTAAALQRGGDPPEVAEMRQYLGIPVPPPPVATVPLTPAAMTSLPGWRGRLHYLFRPALDLKDTDRVWRKHWWRLVEATAVSGNVFNLGLILGVVMIWRMGLGPWLFLPLILLIVGGIWNTWNVIDWQNDLYILTDERIIDLEKVPLIFEDRREARLLQIQDVHYLMPHFINRFLDFGDVEVETAGRGGAFTFSSIPHPREVQAEIFTRLDRARKAAGAGDRQRQEADLLGVLYKYHQASAPPPPP
jgi:membrane protein YdbS with pleckstrin-like domain